MHCGVISLTWQLHRKAKSETRDAQTKLKGYEPVSFLFMVVCCWHNANGISHLMSDTAVIKTWKLMMFAIPFVVQSLAAVKTSLLDSAHTFHG